ncbi:MAG: TspO protein [candidate division Zixibacteria bacterium SM1_73]|nr:MAG: TspO protein [candidate division Zixibacteria bacterium SM1_73]
MEKKMSIEILKLVISIVVCQLAGVIGSIFTTPAIATWYATLKKPSFTPPNWLFSPVWITLFVLMGIAAFLVWNKGLHDKGVKIALSVFIVQLILNALWSVMFFGLKSPLAGLIDIVVLWIAILLTISYFFKVSNMAGILLIPYILWVTFAAVLNFSIWRLNS